MNTYDKYYWVLNHVAFLNEEQMETVIEVTPHNVCPTTERVEDYKPLNTKLQYWVELLVPWFDKDHNTWHRAHEGDCDCGGWTYEEAIDNLYDLVLKKFGDYTEEDYDKKFWSFYDDPNNTSSFFQSIKGQRLEKKELSKYVLKDYEINLSRRDRTDYEKSQLALTTFYPTATVQQQKEIDVLLKNLEHDIWVHDQETKWRMTLK